MASLFGLAGVDSLASLYVFVSVDSSDIVQDVSSFRELIEVWDKLTFEIWFVALSTKRGLFAVALLLFSNLVFGFVGVFSVLDIVEDVLFRELVEVWDKLEVES